eukprot:TRINITY_DN28902_c0_g1_i2.p1 TRINITY_DN28902_c0_g1~~TRINITY_DN28902_c0_g1_i2.p1  ORF type:complete len:150 (-),score=12.78 TRINITY_DN28902_c0_g1_i2:73-522(-)
MSYRPPSSAGSSGGGSRRSRRSGQSGISVGSQGSVPYSIDCYNNGGRQATPAASVRSDIYSERSGRSERSASWTRGHSGPGQGRPDTAMSEASNASRSSRRSASASSVGGRSGIGEIPRPAQWMPPTRQALGQYEESEYSDVSRLVVDK